MARKKQRNVPLPVEREQELLDKVYAIFDTVKLTAKRYERALPVVRVGTEAQPLRCATPQIAELVGDLTRHYDALSPETKSEVEKYIRLVKEGEDYRVEYVSREGG
jgi:hypothetical protein